MAAHEHAVEYGVAITKLAPPVLVTTWSVGGHGLAEWVCVLTIVYTLLQLGLLVRKTYKDRKNL